MKVPSLGFGTLRDQLTIISDGLLVFRFALRKPCTGEHQVRAELGVWHVLQPREQGRGLLDAVHALEREHQLQRGLRRRRWRRECARQCRLRAFDIAERHQHGADLCDELHRQSVAALPPRQRFDAGVRIEGLGARGGIVITDLRIARAGRMRVAQYQSCRLVRAAIDV